ncbi:MAG TPA: glycosyltransferase family 1 protein [Candidatus Babeliales bacterium]|nr:glycosyltransferase family 1 protein [Candidatus Babeliales bacterium]
MPPLRLAVDARVIAQDTRGIGRYARAVLRRLVVRDDVELTLLATGLFPRRMRGDYERALGSGAFAVGARAAGTLDVIWHPANGTFFSSPIPSVATIHDAVPFHYPDPDPRRREHAQQPFLRSARTAARIVAVSHFGASEVRELLHVPAERIEVIEHGVETSFVPGPPEPLPPPLRGRRFLLFVGDPIAEPRKNFKLLYAAYRRAWPQGEGPALAVAGPRAPELPGVIAVGNLGDDLIVGRDESLRACYRGALALALASYHETFGMPMLEAMGCGTPVVAARAGSLPEIGGDAALYAPADDVQAWAVALRSIVDDEPLRARLRVAGVQRAATFSWDESARRHVELFRAVAR